MRTTKVRYSSILSELYEADIDINSSYSLSNYGAAGCVDIQSGITHELGHLLGLADSSSTTATMYNTLTLGSISARTLSQDDINGINYIY